MKHIMFKSMKRAAAGAGIALALMLGTINPVAALDTESYADVTQGGSHMYITFQSLENIPDGIAPLSNLPADDFVLPATGGSGVSGIMLGGTLLSCGAIAAYAMKKRQDQA